MSDILSQDEINALLNNMGDGGDLEFGDPEPEAAPIVSTPMPQASPASSQSFNLAGIEDETVRNLFDTKIELIVRFGSKSINISAIVGLKAGSVVELDKLQNEPVDIVVNGSFIAIGKLTVVDGYYAVRLSNLVSPEVRLKSLRTQ